MHCSLYPISNAKFNKISTITFLTIDGMMTEKIEKNFLSLRFKTLR